MNPPTDGGGSEEPSERDVGSLVPLDPARAPGAMLSC